MTLTTYKKKRHFDKTPEPKPKVKKTPGKNMRYPSDSTKRYRPSVLRGRSARKIKGFPRFVIQKHHASHLHWDLRLEMDGVLKSWAIPKQPTKAKNIKRLAVQVEDHPLSYAKFQGEIPKGLYGAGKVEIWDKGTYELIEKTREKIEFKLHGKKLKGNYVLVNAKLRGDKRNWLLIRV